MRDIILAVFALAGLAGFLSILIWRVPELSLIVVFTAVFLMAAYDFWLEVQRPKNGNGG